MAIYLSNALLFLVTGSVCLKKGAHLAFIVSRYLKPANQNLFKKYLVSCKVYVYTFVLTLQPTKNIF